MYDYVGGELKKNVFYVLGTVQMQTCHLGMRWMFFKIKYAKYMTSVIKLGAIILSASTFSAYLSSASIRLKITGFLK